MKNLLAAGLLLAATSAAAGKKGRTTLNRAQIKEYAAEYAKLASVCEGKPPTETKTYNIVADEHKRGVRILSWWDLRIITNAAETSDCAYYFIDRVRYNYEEKLSQPTKKEAAAHAKCNHKTEECDQYE